VLAFADKSGNMQHSLPRVALENKRTLSVPCRPRKVARTDSGPNPWKTLGPLGETATRTASALAELAAQTNNMPETWLAQNAIAEAATHDILRAQEDARARVVDLQLRYKLLEEHLEDARQQILMLDIGLMQDVDDFFEDPVSAHRQEAFNDCASYQWVA
jgi:hypothetical protein